MQITGGFLNSRKIKMPSSPDVRPTLSKTRQAFFNSLSSLIDFESKKFLDLFAGSGIMSFEAVSRGFKDVCSIEKSRKTIDIIKQNCRILDVELNLIVGDSIKVISKMNETFDVIFIDPPYDSDLYDKSLKAVLSNKILNPGGIVALEHTKDKAVDLTGFVIIKQKEYSDKVITFLSIEKV